MQRRANIHRLLSAALLGTTLAALSVWACSVPVFRYALEHWGSDAYQAVVFHRGPLTEEQSSLVNDLGSNGLAGRLHANLSPKSVDLDANPAPEWLELSRQSGAERFPWLVLRSPRDARSPGMIWSGPLAGKNITELLDSPARKEIVERLSQGQSAVWVLLESGDQAQDAAAAREIESRLKYLGATLALPKPDPQDIVNGLLSVPPEDLRLEFSLLRLSRNNAEEQAFIQILLGTEKDLATANQPIVIPIFGQGRALYALVGAGISRETIDRAATFLIGKCSCQVKEQNPGTDLLFAADWKSMIKAGAAEVPDLPPFSALAKSAPVTVTITGGDNAGSKRGGMATALSGSQLGQIGVTLVIAAVLAAAVIFMRRQR